MTGRQLDLTQRQVRALCQGAKKEGYVPLLRIGEAQVWLLPEDRAAELFRERAFNLEEERVIDL